MASKGNASHTGRAGPAGLGVLLPSLLFSACVVAAEGSAGLAAKRAPPLPPPSGPVVRAASVEELFRACEDAAPGSTILLAEGRYFLPGLLRLRGLRGVTLRGASGDRDRVVLDGSRSRSKELIWFESCEDVTVADLTLESAPVHGFTIKGESNVQRPRIYNCRIHNVWERGIKGTAPYGKDGKLASAPDEEVLRIRPRGGRIEYCLLENDHPKREDDWTGGDYIGGIDIMWAKDWVIRDNVFRGIRGKKKGGRAAVFVWNNSEDVLVEGNLVVGCDTGIAFGNPSGGERHMTRGVLRNNFIVRGSYKAIELARTADCQVYLNTVWSEDLSWGRTVHLFQGQGGGEVWGNLVRGKLLVEDPRTKLRDNVTGDLEGWLVDPPAGDLHLSAEGRRALGAPRLQLPEGLRDLDGEPRGPLGRPGADDGQAPRGR